MTSSSPSPETFDAARQPNDHLAFGFGSHFCLGNSLARVELNVMFERLLARLPDMELAGDALPRRQATFISGLESMPVRFTRHASVAGEIETCSTSPVAAENDLRRWSFRTGAVSVR